MDLTRVFGEGWPWAIGLFWFVLIELWFLVGHQRTLSERARSLDKKYPWLPYVVMAVFVVLVGHFWWGWLW